MMERITEASPRLTARIAGVFYLLNIVTAPIAFYGSSRPGLAFAAGIAATASYVAVTVLFYYLFRPVNRRLSLVAALFSLAGCAVGELGARHLAAIPINPLVFFGCYCLLIGYLILRSTFLPRILGAPMVIAGLGWLTFVSPRLAHYLSPYVYYPGGIGEGLLTLWLVAMGVNAERWKEQAGAAGQGTGGETAGVTGLARGG
jgi:multisubunit Na+/H+ antiporter MnhB subunit